MTEQAWLEYRTLSAELDDLAARPRRGKDRGLAIARLRRRRDSVAGRYLGGLRTLTGLAISNGYGKGLDLAAELAKQEVERARL